MEFIKHWCVVFIVTCVNLELSSALNPFDNHFATECGKPSYVPTQNGILVINGTILSGIHCATICLNMANDVCIGYNLCEVDGQKQCGLAIRPINVVGRLVYCKTDEIQNISTCVFYRRMSEDTVSVWPKGKAVLLQPQDGCPTGWGTPVITFHLQTGGNSHHGSSSNVKGPLTGDKLDWYFCTKRTDDGPYLWPVGNYCVCGVTCPTGFQTGRVVFDMEDDLNKDNVVLPFCCRNDGLASTAIDLPTVYPFYLFRYKGQCQEVRGLLVEEEFTHFDTENDNNNNELIGETPYAIMDGTDIEVHYCFYHNS